MPRPIRPWFRFYVEAFSDRKLRRLTPTQRWIWVAVLGAARDSPTGGDLLIAEGVPMTYDELADFADVKPREIGPAITAMQRLGMVSLGDDGMVSVSNWNSRQFEATDNVTKRTQAHRERSKERSNDVPGNTPETETETDKKTSSSTPRKRGARLRDDWKPTAEDIAWQRAEGMDDIFARRELVKFVNYWTAKSDNATKLDWSKTWRNWLLTARDRTPQRRERDNDDPMGWAR